MISLALGAGLGAGGVVAGSLALYLCSPNQQLRAAPLGRGALAAGVGLLLAGLGAFLAVMGAPAAVATWFVALMTMTAVLPFIALITRRRS